jgi:Tfp pilus assembly protein PilZ
VEQRRYARAPISLSLIVTQKDDDGYVEGRATDISLGGMFVETSTPFAFNTPVMVHVRLPSGDEELEFQLPAIVRWVQRQGMGLQFRLLGARETHVITEIVRRNDETQGR